MNSVPIPIIPEKIRPGDVLSIRFPLAENPSQPGPKVRPVIVLADHKDSKCRKLTVTYGTSAKPRKFGKHLLPLHHPDSLAAAGLDKRTTFNLNRTITVPFDKEFFVTSPDGQFRLGTLKPLDIRRCRKAILNLINSYNAQKGHKHV